MLCISHRRLTMLLFSESAYWCYHTLSICMNLSLNELSPLDIGRLVYKGMLVGAYYMKRTQLPHSPNNVEHCQTWPTCVLSILGLGGVTRLVMAGPSAVAHTGPRPGVQSHRQLQPVINPPPHNTTTTYNITS